VRSGLPVLELDIEFINLKGKKVTPEHSRLVDKTAETRRRIPTPATESCPELIGGDTRNGYQPSEKEKRGENCPNIARWLVKRHPIALSLYFREGKQVLEVFETEARVKELFASRFVQGLFYEPLHSAGIRAEDLRLEGFDGAFLARLIREAVAAHGELHYDAAHGRKGFVFSFVRDECPFAAKALPVIASVLARSGYRIPRLKEPVLEMRIGRQRIFLTQVKDRVYLANGLEGLINVLESLPPPSRDLPRTPLVLTVRAEALVEKFLPVVVGAPTWKADFGFELSPEAAGTLQFAAGKPAKHLRPKLFKGVLASIPHDVFAALVTSFHPSPEMTNEQWRQLATGGPGDRVAAGPEEGGFALLWDLSSEDGPISHLGVVIANQTAPDEVEKFKQYFAYRISTAECGGGTVFLAATSSTLLARMRESCESQSLSVLDWEQGARTNEYEAAQLFLFMNPATGMRELFLAGGAKGNELEDFDPQWKQNYEKALAAMRAEGERVFASLPIFAYAGSAAPTAELVRLKGLTVYPKTPLP
jgi:hypothetical protein